MPKMMTSVADVRVLPGRTNRVVMEWRQREARETLHEIARQEGLDWLVREVLTMVRRDG